MLLGLVAGLDFGTTFLVAVFVGAVGAAEEEEAAGVGTLDVLDDPFSFFESSSGVNLLHLS